MKKILFLVAVLVFLFYNLIESHFNGHQDEDFILLNADNYRLNISKKGYLSVFINEDVYSLHSNILVPDIKILSPDSLLNRGADNSHVLDIDEDNIYLYGENETFKIFKTINIDGTKISISDTFENKTQQPIGWQYQKTLEYESFSNNIYLSGHNARDSFTKKIKSFIKSFLNLLAESFYTQTGIHSPSNQTVFIGQKNSSLGFLYEDVISKAKSYLTENSINKTINLESRDLFLSPKSSLSIDYSLYLSSKPSNYFDFVNRIRDEKNINSIVQGSFNFFNIIQNKDLLDDEKKLTEYIKSLGLKILALTPWLDYDNYNQLEKTFISREDYLILYKDAIQKLKAINPEIKLLGSIQTNIVALPEDFHLGIEEKENLAEGFSLLTEKSSKNVRTSGFMWPATDLATNQENLIVTEHFLRDEVRGLREINIAVLPYLGSYQENFIKQQIKFLIKEVGLDGVYLDQFNQTDISSLQRYSYNEGDGYSAIIDKHSGAVEKHFTDLAISSITFQKELTNYLTNNEIFFVANTFPLDLSLNTSKSLRFGEGFWSMYSEEFWKSTKRPTSSKDLAKGHLSSPSSLALPNWLSIKSNINYSKILFKNIIYNLSHGNLTYFAQETKSLNGDTEIFLEENPLNYVFPIEITRIDNGFIKGKKNFLTTVSRTFHIEGAQVPKIYFYNQEGIKENKVFQMRRHKFGWLIDIEIQDWNELVIITM